MNCPAASSRTGSSKTGPSSTASKTGLRKSNAHATHHTHAAMAWRLSSWTLWGLPFLGGLAALGVCMMMDPSLHGVYLGMGMAVVTGAALTDIQRFIVPNMLLGVAVVAALPISIALGKPIIAYLLPGGSALAVLLGLRWVSSLWLGRVGLGMGDVKLAGVLGLYFGWSAFWILYLAAALGSLVGIVGLGLGLMERTTRLPFAALIALGTLLHFVLPYPL